MCLFGEEEVACSAKKKKKCDSENDLSFAVASSAVYVRTYVPVAYVCVRTVGSTCVRSKTVANTTYLVLTPSVHHAWGLAEVARLGLTLFTKFSPTRAGLRRKPRVGRVGNFNNVLVRRRRSCLFGEEEEKVRQRKRSFVRCCLVFSYVRTYVPVAYVCVRTVGSTCVRSKTVVKASVSWLWCVIAPTQSQRPA